MALFKKLTGSRSKSTSDILSFAPSDDDTSKPKPSDDFHAQARASRSTENLKAASASSESAPPSPGAKKAWVPKQRPTPAPYRHVPTHAATDAFRTLQGNGTAVTPQPYNYSYWQNLGVYGKGGGRTHMKRSQSSSEISSGSIDSILCSCQTFKADDGYYHPILAQEMRHCCHSPIRKQRSSIRSSAPSTATSTPASSIYHLETSSSRGSSFKDPSIVRPVKSVSFSDDHLLTRRSFDSLTTATPQTTEPTVYNIDPNTLKFTLSSDDDSTDSRMPSIPESDILEPAQPPNVVVIGAEPVEELEEEVVAEAIAEDDATSVSAFQADEVVMLQEQLGRYVIQEEQVPEEQSAEAQPAEAQFATTQSAEAQSAEIPSPARPTADRSSSAKTLAHIQHVRERLELAAQARAAGTARDSSSSPGRQT